MVWSHFTLASSHFFANHFTLLLLDCCMISFRLFLLLFAFIFAIHLIILASILISSLLWWIHDFIVTRWSNAMVIIVLMIISKIWCILELSSIISAWIILRLFNCLCTLTIVIAWLIISHTELDRQAFFILWRRKQCFQFSYHVLDFGLVASIVNQRNTEHTTQVFHQLDSEVTVLVQTISRSTEWTFKCEWINQIEFFPHDNSGCWFTCFLHYKVTIIETKVFSILME